MPVEIRELIIRVTATDENESEKESESSEESEEISAVVQENIVQEAVRRVLQILEKQKER
jgi:Family of unknown function (DUF5908)